MKNYVSIPHRFNSHKIKLVKESYEKYKFQSLTGSIHTEKGFGDVGSLVEFQSLTGSIHTFEVDGFRYKDSLFQSLTGSIHTLVLEFNIKHPRSSFNPSQVQFTPTSMM